MSKIKFELNKKGVAELMKSGNMEYVIEDYAAGIAIKAGANFDYDLHTGKNRVNARVFPWNYEGKVENSKNNTLLKAMR